MSPTSTRSPGCAGGTHPVQVHQTGASGFEELLEFLVRRLLAGIDPLEVCDQLRGDPTTGLAGSVTGSDLRQKCLRLGGGEETLGTTGDQLKQQLVQLGGHPGVVLT